MVPTYELMMGIKSESATSSSHDQVFFDEKRQMTNKKTQTLQFVVSMREDYWKQLRKCIFLARTLDQLNDVNTEKQREQKVENELQLMMQVETAPSTSALHIISSKIKPIWHQLSALLKERNDLEASVKIVEERRQMLWLIEGFPGMQDE